MNMLVNSILTIVIAVSVIFIGYVVVKAFVYLIELTSKAHDKRR